MARLALAFACLYLLVGCDRRRQAVVAVEIDETLMQALDRVDVSALDEESQLRGATASFALKGKQGVGSRFSFGAVSASGRQLVLRFHGFDQHGQPVFKQLLRRVLRSEGVTQLGVRLKHDCVSAVPCTQPPTDCDLEDEVDDHECEPADAEMPADAAVPEASPVPPDEAEPDQPALCVLDTVQHCGGCNQACSTVNLSDLICRGGQCAGRCDDGWGDCDKNRPVNGCETNLRTSPIHCGGCEGEQRVCPYQVCTDGFCRTRVEGWHDGSVEVRKPANRMLGMRVSAAESGVLAGLGIRLAQKGGQPNARFRLALYSSNEDLEQSPGKLIDQTAEMTAHGASLEWSGILGEYGGLEMRVLKEARLVKGSVYWIFVIASDFLDVLSFDATVSWSVSSNEVPYSALDRMPDVPNQQAALQREQRPVGSLYMISNPNPLP